MHQSVYFHFVKIYMKHVYETIFYRLLDIGDNFPWEHILIVQPR